MNLPYDKLMHLTAGLLLGAVAGIVSGSPMVALVTALGAGLAKEVYDNVSGGDVEVMDVVATTAGGAIVAALLKFVQYMGH